MVSTATRRAREAFEEKTRFRLASPPRRDFPHSVANCATQMTPQTTYWLRWVAVLPVAFVLWALTGYALALCVAFVRRVGNDGSANAAMTGLFLVQGAVFVVVGTFIAPSATLATAAILAVIQLAVTWTSPGRKDCAIAGAIGASLAAGYFFLR